MGNKGYDSRKFSRTERHAEVNAVSLWSLCMSTWILSAVWDSLPRLFFFSSRRRHTRCSRDWSSDVCSSDLQQRSGPGKQLRRVHCGDVAKSKRLVRRETRSHSHHFRIRDNAWTHPATRLQKIGRASCRERGVVWGGGVAIK